MNKQKILRTVLTFFALLILPPSIFFGFFIFDLVFFKEIFYSNPIPTVNILCIISTAITILIVDSIKKIGVKK